MIPDHFVCLVSRDHPCIDTRLSRKQFESALQIDVVTRGTGHWLLYKALEDAKVARRGAVRVPSFLGLTQIVAHSDWFALVPARLGKTLSKEADVKILAAPIKLPSYIVKQYWHERYHRNPANIWFRTMVAELLRDGRKRPR